jgi:hypothetical protein
MTDTPPPEAPEPPVAAPLPVVGWHADESRHRRFERNYWIVYILLTTLTTVGALAAATFAYKAYKASEGAVIEARNQVTEAKRQATAAEAQIVVARDTAERQLRAYIGFDWSNILLNNPADGQMTAWVRLKNFGATPAYKLKFWMKFSRLALSADPFSEAGNFNDPSSVLEPTGTINSSATLPNPADQLQQVIDGKVALFVWGRAEYVDAFGKHHFFSFKGKMHGPTQSVVSDGTTGRGWGFAAIENGMDAD